MQAFKLSFTHGRAFCSVAQRRANLTLLRRKSILHPEEELQVLTLQGYAAKSRPSRQCVQKYHNVGLAI